MRGRTRSAVVGRTDGVDCTTSAVGGKTAMSRCTRVDVGFTTAGVERTSSAVDRRTAMARRTRDDVGCRTDGVDCTSTAVGGRTAASQRSSDDVSFRRAAASERERSVTRAGCDDVGRTIFWGVLGVLGAEGRFEPVK
jgi:hypothetical protein